VNEKSLYKKWMGWSCLAINNAQGERESFLDEYSERNKISTNLSIPLNSYIGGRKICTGHDYVSD
jgi:hypothetical protein